MKSDRFGERKKMYQMIQTKCTIFVLILYSTIYIGIYNQNVEFEVNFGLEML